MKNKKVIVFDLDDTLILELDYLKSAFHHIAHFVDANNTSILYYNMLKIYYENKDVFGWLSKKYPRFEKRFLLESYRTHFPKLKLNEETKQVLDHFYKKGYIIGMVTDGRSVTQRNKLKSIDIEQYLNKVIISEEVGSLKPEKENYAVFEEYKADEYYYIGDNVQKDFIAPNALGWTTICLLDRGYNIHPQSFDYPISFLPKYKVHSLSEALQIIERESTLKVQ